MQVLLWVTYVLVVQDSLTLQTLQKWHFFLNYQIFLYSQINPVAYSPSSYALLCGCDRGRTLSINPSLPRTVSGLWGLYTSVYTHTSVISLRLQQKSNFYSRLFQAWIYLIDNTSGNSNTIATCFIYYV